MDVAGDKVLPLISQQRSVRLRRLLNKDSPGRGEEWKWLDWYPPVITNLQETMGGGTEYLYEGCGCSCAVCLSGMAALLRNFGVLHIRRWRAALMRALSPGSIDVLWMTSLSCSRRYRVVGCSPWRENIFCKSGMHLPNLPARHN